MKKLLLLAFLLLPIFKSNAWGEKGHAMVAQVAFSYIDENTKKNLLSYLDGMTIEEAAKWKDNIKGDKSKDFRKPYHDANFPKGFRAADRGAKIVHVLNNTILELGAKEKLTIEEIKTKIFFFSIWSATCTSHCMLWELN